MPPSEIPTGGIGADPAARRERVPRSEISAICESVIAEHKFTFSGQAFVPNVQNDTLGASLTEFKQAVETFRERLRKRVSGFREDVTFPEYTQFTDEMERESAPVRTAVEKLPPQLAASFRDRITSLLRSLRTEGEQLYVEEVQGEPTKRTLTREEIWEEFLQEIDRRKPKLAKKAKRRGAPPNALDALQIVVDDLRRVFAQNCPERVESVLELEPFLSAGEGVMNIGKSKMTHYPGGLGEQAADMFVNAIEHLEAWAEKKLGADEAEEISSSKPMITQERKDRPRSLSALDLALMMNEPLQQTDAATRAFHTKIMATQGPAELVASIRASERFVKAVAEFYKKTPPIEDWVAFEDVRRGIFALLATLEAETPSPARACAERMSQEYYDAFLVVELRIAREYSLAAKPWRAAQVSTPILTPQQKKRPHKLSREEWIALVKEASRQKPLVIYIDARSRNAQEFGKRYSKALERIGAQMNAIPDALDDYHDVEKITKQKRTLVREELQQLAALDPSLAVDMRCAEFAALNEIERLVRERYALRGAPPIAKQGQDSDQGRPETISYDEFCNIFERTAASLRVGTAKGEDRKFFEHCESSPTDKRRFFEARDAFITTHQNLAVALSAESTEIGRERFAQFMRDLRAALQPLERVLQSLREHGTDPMHLRYKRVFAETESEVEALFAAKERSRSSLSSMEHQKPASIPRSTLLAKMGTRVAEMRMQMETTYPLIQLLGAGEDTRKAFCAFLDELMKCEQDLPMDIDTWEALTTHRQRILDTTQKHRIQLHQSMHAAVDEVRNHYLSRLDASMKELERNYALRGTPQQTEVAPSKPKSIARSMYLSLLQQELERFGSVNDKIVDIGPENAEIGNQFFALFLKTIGERFDTDLPASMEDWSDHFAAARAVEETLSSLMPMLPKRAYSFLRYLRESYRSTFAALEDILRRDYDLRGAPAKLAGPEALRTSISANEVILIYQRWFSDHVFEARSPALSEAEATAFMDDQKRFFAERDRLNTLLVSTVTAWSDIQEWQRQILSALDGWAAVAPRSCTAIVQGMRQHYLHGFHAINREIARRAALVGTPLPEGGAAEQPVTPKSTRLEGQTLNREQVWEEIRQANREANRIGGIPDRDFEGLLKQEVEQICPTVVHTPSDLEELSYVLLGRTEAMEAVLPPTRKGPKCVRWRQVNSEQFRAALARLLSKLQPDFPTIPPPDWGSLISHRPLAVEPSEALETHKLLEEVFQEIRSALFSPLQQGGQRRTRLSKGTLVRYCDALESALSEFADRWLPPRIDRPGPLYALLTFLGEAGFSIRFWLDEYGTYTDQLGSTLRSRLENAYMPFLHQHIHALSPKEADTMRRTMQPPDQPSSPSAAPSGLITPLTAEELWKLCEPAIDDLKYVMQAHGVTAKATGEKTRSTHTAVTKFLEALQAMIRTFPKVFQDDFSTPHGMTALCSLVTREMTECMEVLSGIEEERDDAIHEALYHQILTIARSMVRRLEKENPTKSLGAPREDLIQIFRLSCHAYPTMFKEHSPITQVITDHARENETMLAQLPTHIEQDDALKQIHTRSLDHFQRTVEPCLCGIEPDGAAAFRRNSHAVWDAFLSMVHANYELKGAPVVSTERQEPGISVPKTRIRDLFQEISARYSREDSGGFRLGEHIKASKHPHAKKLGAAIATYHQADAEIYDQLTDFASRQEFENFIATHRNALAPVLPLAKEIGGEIAQLSRRISDLLDEVKREGLRQFYAETGMPVTVKERRTQISHDELTALIGSVDTDGFIRTWGPKGKKQLSHGQCGTVRKAVEAFEKGWKQSLKGMPDPIVSHVNVGRVTKAMREAQTNFHTAVAHLPQSPREALRATVSRLFEFDTRLLERYELASTQEDTVAEVLTVRAISKRALAEIYRSIQDAHALSDEDQQFLFTALHGREGGAFRATYQTYVREQQTLLSAPKSNLPAKLREAFKPLANALMGLQDQELAKRVCSVYEEAFSALEREIASLFHTEETAADALLPKP